MRIFILALLLLLPADVMAAWSVWTESLLIDKVQQAYNPGTKPTSITIKGAKNEYVMFQMVARSSGESMAGFTPSIVSAFTSGANTIPDANIAFYLCNYISTVSGSAVYEPAGEWPDICVPYKDRFYNETRDGTENGWGQTITENKSQPFLVELYIPSNTVSGTYSGTIRLTSNSGALSQDIPVTLEVWNFTLPAQWSLKTSWGAEYYYADATGTNNAAANVRKEYYYRLGQMFLDHGVNLYGGDSYSVTNAYGDPPVFDNADFTGAYGFKNFLDGTSTNSYIQKPLPIPNFWSTRRSDMFPVIVRQRPSLTTGGTGFRQMVTPTQLCSETSS